VEVEEEVKESLFKRYLKGELLLIHLEECRGEKHACSLVGRGVATMYNVHVNHRRASTIKRVGL
jgi:hypothetical protein